MTTGSLQQSLRRLFAPSRAVAQQLASSDKILIVGLGNYPAPRSRHSVGQYLLQYLADKNSVQLSHNGRCKAHLASFIHNDAQIYLLKPKVFMNVSGKSVQKATKLLGIAPSHVLLLHDELDLPLGKFKVKHGGSANGHNGVLDTQERLQNTDIKRVRIGIGRPDNKDDVSDYVLSDFDKAEKNLLSVMRDSLVDTIYQTISIMLGNTADTQEGRIEKLNVSLDNLPEWVCPPATPSPTWTPPTPRDRVRLAKGSRSSGALGTLVMLGALHKVNYNNNRPRDVSTPHSSPGRRRYSGETVPQVFPYESLDVRKDYNKRESKIIKDCNKRLDYRMYRRDRRDSDSSGDM